MDPEPETPPPVASPVAPGPEPAPVTVPPAPAPANAPALPAVLPPPEIAIASAVTAPSSQLAAVDITRVQFAFPLVLSSHYYLVRYADQTGKSYEVALPAEKGRPIMLFQPDGTTSDFAALATLPVSAGPERDKVKDALVGLRDLVAALAAAPAFS